jgi:cyclic beta-1,2-glucan synthetase
VISECDPDTKALLATNPWNAEFGDRTAFVDLAGRQTAFTADRTEFLGRNGTTERPAGLARGRQLQQAAGAGMDPCGVLQTSFELAPGARTELVVTIGQTETRQAAIDLIKRARLTDHAATLSDVERWWGDVQSNIEVRTPDRAMDIMVNGWLVYQTLACRLWARAALYQAGGAIGFRDQLQDVIALIVPRRELAREHLLRAAAHQFVEGDVQHWWHPPSGRGVRTHISDDRLWLPYAVERYLASQAWEHISAAEEAAVSKTLIFISSFASR